MQRRGDRDHDIAAWFGVNQGRVAEAKDGRYGAAQPAPTTSLPPKGPPGVKGRRLRASVERAIEILEEKDTAGLDEALKMLRDAQTRYDANEA